MHEGEIQHGLFVKFANDSIIMAPNIYFKSSRWESDLLRINRNLYRFEYEIKTSRADFKSEFKSKSHKHKHFIGSDMGPNYYYFAVPDSLIYLDEIDPSYGLIYCKRWHNSHYVEPKIIQRAKRLHSGQVPQDAVNRIAKSLMYKVFNQKETINQYIREKDEDLKRGYS